MRTALARRLGAPAVLLALVPVSLAAAERDETVPPPQQQVAVADPLAVSPEQAALVTRLWEAWDSDLRDDEEGELPVGLVSLEPAEALYVLLTLRAAQLAEAAAQAGPDVDLQEAVARAGLAAQPPGVAAARVPDVADCVVLTHVDEPYGRRYYGAAGAPAEPGPEPLSRLEETLLRTARVGISEADDATCGMAVAYSPAAQQVLVELQALQPALLVE